MVRFRAFSIAALLLLSLSAASLLAAGSAQRAESRGGTIGYPLPIRGAEALRMGVFMFNVHASGGKAMMEAAVKKHPAPPTSRT